MAELWRAGAFVPDPWTVVGGDDPLPEAGAVFVPRARLAAEGAALSARPDPLGVTFVPGETLDGLEPLLPRVAAVRLALPKFNDGRLYTIARLLRGRHGFTGEIRAAGDVLLDQLGLLARAGVDAFEISDPAVRVRLAAGWRPPITRRYQGALGEPPIRRAPATENL